VALLLAALLIADLLLLWTRLGAEFAPDGRLDRAIVFGNQLDRTTPRGRGIAGVKGFGSWFDMESS
jgi:hypothetical protein